MRPTTARKQSSRSAFGRVRRRLAESRKRTRAALGAAALATCAALFFAFQPTPEPEPIVLGAGKAGVKTVATAPVAVPPEHVAPLPAPESAEAPEPVEKGRLHESGEASYYGEELAGRPTASGETFDPSKMTAAHRTLPLGTRLRVTNTKSGESVVVRVNDRGPFAKNRVLDLSKGAAKRIGMLRSGTARVKIELLPS